MCCRQQRLLSFLLGPLDICFHNAVKRILWLAAEQISVLSLSLSLSLSLLGPWWRISALSVPIFWCLSSPTLVWESRLEENYCPSYVAFILAFLNQIVTGLAPCPGHSCWSSNAIFPCWYTAQGKAASYMQEREDHKTDGTDFSGNRQILPAQLPVKCSLSFKGRTWS